MAKDTKEKVLDAALEMFSRNGYASTNVRELAGSPGMGKPSIRVSGRQNLNEEPENTAIPMETKLTVFFDAPFWVGNFERIDEGKMSVFSCFLAWIRMTVKAINLDFRRD